MAPRDSRLGHLTSSLYNSHGWVAAHTWVPVLRLMSRNHGPLLRSVGPKPYCPVRDRECKTSELLRGSSGLGHLPCAGEGEETGGDRARTSVFLSVFACNASV